MKSYVKSVTDREGKNPIPIPIGFEVIEVNPYPFYVRIKDIEKENEFTGFPTGNLCMKLFHIQESLEYERLCDKIAKEEHREIAVRKAKALQSLSSRRDNIIRTSSFYVCTYEASRGEDNKPQSISGKKPWNNISWGACKKGIPTENAVDAAFSMYPKEENRGLVSFLPNRIESKLLWDYMASAYSFPQTLQASNFSGRLHPTGMEKETICGIANYFGNLAEWIYEVDAVVEDYATAIGGNYSETPKCETILEGKKYSCISPNPFIGFRPFAYLR